MEILLNLFFFYFRSTLLWSRGRRKCCYLKKCSCSFMVITRLWIPWICDTEWILKDLIEGQYLGCISDYHVFFEVLQRCYVKQLLPKCSMRLLKPINSWKLLSSVELNLVKNTIFYFPIRLKEGINVCHLFCST